LAKLILYKISGRKSVILDVDEITGQSDFKYERHPDACGVVIDKGSEHGFVQVSGGDKATTKVLTGQNDLDQERYVYVDILNGQTCMLYGRPTVLYIRPQPSK
jgi:hypothetical protein